MNKKHSRGRQLLDASKNNKYLKVLRFLLFLGLGYLVILSLLTGSLRSEDLLNESRNQIVTVLTAIKNLFFAVLSFAILVGSLAAGVYLYIFLKTKIQGDESHLQQDSKSGPSIVAFIIAVLASVYTFNILDKGVSATFHLDTEVVENSNVGTAEESAPVGIGNDNVLDVNSILFDSLEVYKNTGISGLIDHSKSCYKTLDQTVSYNSFKKCVLIDVFSHELDAGIAKTSELPLADYFSTKSFQNRAATYIKTLGFAMAEVNTLLSECESEVRNYISTEISK